MLFLCAKVETSTELTMSFIKDYPYSTSFRAGLWEMKESEEELRQKILLTPPQEAALQLRKTSSGRKGFLATRIVLSELGGALQHLSFDDLGAPSLFNEYCSLSHTQTMAGAVISSQPVGIDVEIPRDQIFKIQSKFVHQNENYALKSSDPLSSLTRLWTAKEAIYKCLKVSGISLSKQIYVSAFDLADTQGSAEVFLAAGLRKFRLHFSTFKNSQITVAQYDRS